MLKLNKLKSKASFYLQIGIKSSFMKLKKNKRFIIIWISSLFNFLNVMSNQWFVGFITNNNRFELLKLQIKRKELVNYFDNEMQIFSSWSIHKKRTVEIYFQKNQISICTKRFYLKNEWISFCIIFLQSFDKKPSIRK